MDKYNISESTMFDLFTEFVSMTHVMKEEEIKEMKARLEEDQDALDQGLPKQPLKIHQKQMSIISIDKAIRKLRYGNSAFTRDSHATDGLGEEEINKLELPAHIIM